MNTKQYLFAIVIVFASLLTSCDDFLNIKPHGELLPETAADYETLLNHYDMLRASETYPIYMTDDAFLPDQSIGFCGFDYAYPHEQNLYSFSSNLFGDSEDDLLWEEAYRRIYNYNVVIHHISSASKATEEMKQSLRAEALLGRAYEYLILVNIYAKHYDPKTATADPGIPLILKDDITLENLTRASVQDVYNSIESDLKEAVAHLPERPKLNAFRASKPAVLGLLARMYLYNGNYAEALKYANEALAKNNFLLDYTKYEVVNPNFAMGRINLPEREKNKEAIYLRSAPNQNGISGYVYASDDLIGIYDKENDQRFDFSMTNAPYGWADQPAPYNSYYLWVLFQFTNVGITTPEIYLTAAECEARVGSKDKAIELINKLRENRIKGNSALSAATNDEALKLVLEERRRELAMVGCTRFIDLKRLNLDPRFAKTITRTVNGETISLPPNDPKYVLPIPAKVLRFNPDMKPNIR
ncbi:MAG: RagB/SusD family nutrient uptake outer membrane protein [Bacteroidia bacterium]|nr:RagB/SusD family nutrient uptake outer membrane protein [Bacteroidia bacterium]